MVLLILLVAMGLPAKPAAAGAQATVQVTGIVRDTTGEPLAGATISARGPAARDAATASDGRFALAGLPAGDYEIMASLRGFAPERRRVRVLAGDPIDLQITLWVSTLATATVTAERTGDRTVQDTPMAVTAIRGADLALVQSRTIEDLAGRAPTVTFSQNTGFSQLTIRGIGTNAVFAGSDPSSAVYLDGVYLARPAAVLSDFLDLERAEVLRGPQGTLYGRNAVGGAINLVTADPTGRFEASVRAAAGNVRTMRVDARVSGPLVGDRVLASASILRGYRDGFVRDLNRGQWLGGEDVTAARGKVLVSLTPRSDLLLATDITYQDPAPLVYAKVLAVKPGFTVDNPSDLHEVRTSVDAWSRNLQYGASARYTLRFDSDLTLTSLTAYRSLDYELQVDADITELDLTVSNVHEIHHQISEELTVSQRRGRLAWLGGLFLFREADAQPTRVPLGGPRRVSRLNPDVEARAHALFGQTTFAVAPRVSAIAGLRYTRESKDIVNSGGQFPFDTPAVPVPGTTYAYTDRISHEAWTPKAGVEVRPARDVLAYATATRGFKSGGFNLTSTQAGRGYAPEWAWSYEAGAKSTLFGGHARLNAAAFLTDYTDLQVQTAILPGVIDISNAAAATIRGVEVEAEARLARTLQGGGHLAWLDASYDRYIAVGVGGAIGDVAGRRLTNAPEWSGRAWLEWTPPAGRRGLLTFRADARWQSTVYFTPFNDDVQRQRPYGVVDVAAEFQPVSGRWSVSAFVRNLAAADYITGSFSSPPPAIGGRPGPTRQGGVQLSIRR